MNVTTNLKREDNSILLHPKLGVNARLCLCPRCGESNGELVMLGIRNTKITCGNCRAVNYGMRPQEKCGKCGHQLYGSKAEELTDWEKVPGHSLCKECEEEVKMQRAIVAEGGIYWKCKCGQSGVIKASNPICAAVRAQSGIAAPKPVGVQFETCERCKPPAASAGAASASGSLTVDHPTEPEGGSIAE